MRHISIALAFVLVAGVATSNRFSTAGTPRTPRRSPRCLAEAPMFGPSRRPDTRSPKSRHWSPATPAGLTLDSKHLRRRRANISIPFGSGRPRVAPVSTCRWLTACGRDKTVQSLSFSVSKTSETTYLSYATSIQGGKPPPAQTGSQHLVAVTERSWPGLKTCARLSSRRSPAAPNQRTCCTRFAARSRKIVSGPGSTADSSVSSRSLRFQCFGDRPRSRSRPAPNCCPSASARWPRSRIVSSRSRFAGNLTGSGLGNSKLDPASLPGLAPRMLR